MDLRVWGTVSGTNHADLKVRFTSSFVLLVLYEQRMSGIG